MVSTTNFGLNPLGPFEMADYIGLDKAKALIDTLDIKEDEEAGFFDELGNASFGDISKASNIQKEDSNVIETQEGGLLNLLLSEGKLGRKSGEGFYIYDKVSSCRTVVLDKSEEAQKLKIINS